MVADPGLLDEAYAVFAIFPAAIAFAGFRHHLAVLMAKAPAPISRRIAINFKAHSHSPLHQGNNA